MALLAEGLRFPVRGRPAVSAVRPIVLSYHNHCYLRSGWLKPTRPANDYTHMKGVIEGGASITAFDSCTYVSKEIVHQGARDTSRLDICLAREATPAPFDSSGLKGRENESMKVHSVASAAAWSIVPLENRV